MTDSQRVTWTAFASLAMFSVLNANFQRIDAEAKVLKLEQELSEAKALQLKLTAKTSFLVSDIRKVQYFLIKISIYR